jgi:hypothetical protein
MTKYLLALLLAAASPGSAQESVERFLVPIVAQEQPGAYGSIWTSTLRVYNAGHESVVLYPAPTCESGLCSDLTPADAGYERSFALYKFPPDAPPGRVLYVYEGPATLFFHLRVRDMSRAAQSMGVQIPVIPEADLFRDEVALLGVPGDARFRHTLRIYDINNQPSSFRIRVFSGLQRIHIHEETITLFMNLVDPGVQPREEVIGPSAAQLDFRDRIPDGDHLYYLTIEPLQESLFWAFLSITNNETQEVTLVLPNSSRNGS